MCMLIFTIQNYQLAAKLIIGGYKSRETFISYIPLHESCPMAAT